MEMTPVTINLPPVTLATVQQQAQSNGESLQDFISHLIDEAVGAPVLLSPSTLSAIALGIEDTDAGRSYTLDEVRANLSEQRNAWLQAQQ